MKRFLALGLLLTGVYAPAQAQPGNPLKHLLRRDTAAVVRRVLAAPDAHRLQIIYTQIRRDRQGRPRFKSYAYRLRPDEYFYPASTVKLPAAAVALQKMRRLSAAPLGRETPLRIDSAFAGQSRVLADSSAPGYRPTIGQYIRKVLLVSDNNAYNRLYEYVGQQELNRSLRERGLVRTRIIHRLSVGDKEPGSRHTNPVTFFADTLGRQVLYQQPAAFNEAPLPPLPTRESRVGKAYLEGDRRVEQPLDFSTKNYFPLDEQQQVLRALLFPDFLPPRQRFDLRADDYAFLRKYMSLPPRLSRYPRYNAQEYPDNYAKFLLAGLPPGFLPEGVRIYNKIGQAYGFLIDNACVVDSARGVEFLLSAVVYCNQDEVLNDDQYDYDQVGFPFLRRLGQLVYQYELSRTTPRRTQQVRAYWDPQLERDQMTALQQPAIPLNKYGLPVVDSPDLYRRQVATDARQELVDLVAFIPGLKLDIRYATADNLVGQPFYPEAGAFLRRPVADDLRRAQQELAQLGYGLKIYDAYRPYAATVRLFEALPNETYAAPPSRGSRHNRGCSVDVGLIDLKTGQDLPMPTAFDAVTPAAHADYADLPADVLRHRAALRTALERHGFKNYAAEWWHFDHQGWQQFPLMDVPFSALRR